MVNLKNTHQQQELPHVIDQDIAIVALLLFVVIYLVLFSGGGPGTPRKFRNPFEPARVNIES
jgi:hypothetical protein